MLRIACDGCCPSNHNVYLFQQDISTGLLNSLHKWRQDLGTQENPVFVFQIFGQQTRCSGTIVTAFGQHLPFWRPKCVPTNVQGLPSRWCGEFCRVCAPSDEGMHAYENALTYNGRPFDTLVRWWRQTRTLLYNSGLLIPHTSGLAWFDVVCRASGTWPRTRHPSNTACACCARLAQICLVILWCTLYFDYLHATGAQVFRSESTVGAVRGDVWPRARSCWPVPASRTRGLSSRALPGLHGICMHAALGRIRDSVAPAVSFTSHRAWSSVATAQAEVACAANKHPTHPGGSPRQGEHGRESTALE